jgi:hypothetical protein
MAATMNERLAATFVELADTMVAEYDLMEFLQSLTERCAELLEADAAGLLLADGPGTLRLVAASTEQARVLELFQVQHRQGPCLDSIVPGSLDPAVARAARCLVDVATIGILQERALREQEVIAGQLQVALNSRVVIEQAKGILAERLQVSPDEAFLLLRRFARDRNYRLTELAGDVIRGTAPIASPPAASSGPQAALGGLPRAGPRSP